MSRSTSLALCFVVLIGACAHQASLANHDALAHEQLTEPPTFSAAWAPLIQVALEDFRTLNPEVWECFSIVLEEEDGERLVGFLNPPVVEERGDEIASVVGDTGACGGPGATYRFNNRGALQRRSFHR
jgi:hypothetical protein